MLQPHVVLNAPFYNPLPKQNVAALCFYPDVSFTLESAIENVGPFWEVLGKEKDFYEKNWINLGHIFYLQNFSESFFRVAIKNAEAILMSQIKTGRKFWRDSIRLAWTVTFIEAIQQFPVVVLANWDLCASMMENRNSMFIEYEHGMPPVFNKSMFAYSDSSLLALGGDPIETIRGCLNTSNSHQMATLAGNLVARRS